MSAAYVKIYYKGELIRTFGGNKSAVRAIIAEYKQNISKRDKKELKRDWRFDYYNNR